MQQKGQGWRWSWGLASSSPIFTNCPCLFCSLKSDEEPLPIHAHSELQKGQSMVSPKRGKVRGTVLPSTQKHNSEYSVVPGKTPQINTSYISIEFRHYQLRHLEHHLVIAALGCYLQAMEQFRR